MDKKTFMEKLIHKMEVVRGISLEEATPGDHYIALASLAKDQLTRMWVQTNNTYRNERKKQVYYFSLEFMLGKMLQNNISALGLEEVCQEAMAELGIDMGEIYNVELDPGLGNGGLGRLAACFMDSLASLGLPGHGCSIRYKYGLFEQKIVDGYQVELPDNWLRNENVWEIKKPSKAIIVKFYGHIREEIINGRHLFYHEDYEPIIAMPYDVPMVGHQNKTVNTLRLWSAESTRQFDFESFCSGNYLNAVAEKYSAEAISEVLYPDDSNYKNRMLRLKQQYFFVSAGLQSIVRHYKSHYDDVRELHKYVAVHINDTHPAIAVPELMRILMDDEGLGWDDAWSITTKAISYTNHTIMPEALEKWPVDTFKQLLPRIYMIVREINERFCGFLWQRYEGQWDRITRMAIEANGEIRMAYLAIVGSYAVNGVAAVHSEILKNELFKDFYQVFPQRFNNKTNGVTHRRWLLGSNPRLSRLITDSIGEGWIQDPLQLRLLDEGGLIRDGAFKDRLYAIKRHNKELLSDIILRGTGIAVDPDSVFDVQIKRIHAYKRQLMMLLGIFDMYLNLIDNPGTEMVPRTFIFAGKAAPSYHFAKEVIKLISLAAQIINNDERVRGQVKVVFLENYRVSLAERIFPGADVSEQISTASREASGTGNMKFMMNGAVTIGTRDGANVEILEAVGEENFIVFGMTVSQVLDQYKKGEYNSYALYNGHPRIKRILDEMIIANLQKEGRAQFPNIYDSLLTSNDEFFVLKDFDAYIHGQERIQRLYPDRSRWLEMSGVNIAHSGRFASDEVIKQYAGHIWQIS